MLAKEEIAEYKQLYKNTYGVELDDECATEMAHRLIGLYDAILSDYKTGQNRTNLRKKA